MMHIIGACAEHTTMNLDHELVAEAATILGTRHSVDTVHTALREVIRADRRDPVAALDLGVRSDRP